MTHNRREFLALAAAGVATRLMARADDAHGIAAPKIRAVAFDAFPIFDPRPVFELAEQLFPGRGAELGNVWRSRQFEYQWLRALSRQYADFRQVTEDSLVYAADLLKLDLTAAKRMALSDGYFRLEAWPDVQPALRALARAGISVALVSNATPGMLESCISHSGLAGQFDHVLSTDRIKTFKPDPRAYQMAIDDAQIFCQIEALGDLQKVPSPQVLAAELDPDDMTILRQAAGRVKKKLLLSRQSSPPTVEPNTSSSEPVST